MQLLKDAGIDAAYNLYEEAGVGFADHVCEHMDYCKLKDVELWRVQTQNELRQAGYFGVDKDAGSWMAMDWIL